MHHLPLLGIGGARVGIWLTRKWLIPHQWGKICWYNAPPTPQHTHGDAHGDILNHNLKHKNYRNIQHAVQKCNLHTRITKIYFSGSLSGVTLIQVPWNHESQLSQPIQYSGSSTSSQYTSTDSTTIHFSWFGASPLLVSAALAAPLFDWTQLSWDGPTTSPLLLLVAVSALRFSPAVHLEGLAFPRNCRNLWAYLKEAVS